MLRTSSSFIFYFNKILRSSDVTKVTSGLLVMIKDLQLKKRNTWQTPTL